MTFFFAAASLAALAQEVEVAITPIKPSVQLGEPVYVHVVVTNKGEGDLQIPAWLDPSSEQVVVRVTGPDGTKVGFVPLAVVDTEDAPVSIATGGTTGSTFGVFYGARGWTFQNPGKYAISGGVVIGGAKGRLVESEPFTLEVTDGGEAGKAWLAEPEVGKVLVWMQGDHLGNGLTRLAEVAQRQPDSVHADYANLALGRNLSRPFKDYVKKAVREPECEDALGYLDKVRNENLPDVLVVVRELADATCHAALGDTDAAREDLERADKIIGTQPALAPFADLMAEQRKTLPEEGGTPKEPGRGE